MGHLQTVNLPKWIRESAFPLMGSSVDFDPLLKMIGEAHFVLIGEATHGTHEFYRIRAEITKRLIREKGFRAVAVEADWPDAYQVNRYVRSLNPDEEAIDSLAGFQRFPTWMWRNADVLDFVGWLRHHNDTLVEKELAVGFYGLDLYSLHKSINAVIDYLETADPVAAERAKERYACFDHTKNDPQIYTYTTSLNLSESCENVVQEQLVDLSRHAVAYMKKNGFAAEDRFFCAEQNAKLIKNAEVYYRSLFRGHVASWNLRDQHMVETFESLRKHLSQHEPHPKIVIWAHNSHIGDARATEMGQQGETNIGQLIREQHGSEVFLLGFTTFHGSVTAASDWGEPAEFKQVRPALVGSYEHLFHQTALPRFFLNLRDQKDLASALREPLLERAIGVVYLPQTERISHYFKVQISDQFDAILHFDETRAVEPLERLAEWRGEEAPDTFPTGM